MILGAGGRAAARAWHGEGDARWREGYKQEGDAGRRGRVAGEVGGTWREARIRRAHASSLELGEPARPPLDVPDASIDLLDFSSSVSASFHRLGCRPKRAQQICLQRKAEQPAALSH